MIILRVIGGCLIGLGIIFSITIIGAAIGVPMMILGLIFFFVGKKRAPIIVQVNQSPNDPKRL